MENPDFRRFFDEHFTDHLSIRTVLMLLKSYQAIERNANCQLSVFQKIAALEALIKTTSTREVLVRRFQSFLGSEQEQVQLQGDGDGGNDSRVKKKKIGGADEIFFRNQKKKNGEEEKI